MTDPYQDKSDEARRLREAGDLPASRKLFEELIVTKPESAALRVVLGGVYWDEGFLDQAISSFQTAVRLAPHAEVASLGLFHALLKDGREDEAFDEMSRFTSLQKSAEYDQLLREINGCQTNFADT